jgi:formylglycine-generating enzyme required for sulfatase activity
MDNPKGPAKSMYGYRVLRGGSIYFGANACRTACRNYYQDSRSEKHIGFRIVLPVTVQTSADPKATPK